MSIVSNIYRRIINKYPFPKEYYISLDEYLAAHKEIEQTELGKRRGVLSADIGTPNILIGGIPCIPREKP